MHIYGADQRDQMISSLLVSDRKWKMAGKYELVDDDQFFDQRPVGCRCEPHIAEFQKRLHDLEQRQHPLVLQDTQRDGPKKKDKIKAFCYLFVSALCFAVASIILACYRDTNSTYAAIIVLIVGFAMAVLPFIQLFNDRRLRQNPGALFLRLTPSFIVEASVLLLVLGLFWRKQLSSYHYSISLDSVCIRRIVLLQILK